MAITILASWLVASRARARRAAGFWLFLLGNVVWVIWGWHAAAWAVVALQFALAAINIRGVRRNEESG